MLKNCFYPVQYDNILNKTVGEIICQSEASFTIVCNLCELKIFQFNEFVKHFRLLHWSDTNRAAIICKTEQDNGKDAIKPTDENLIKTETSVERDDDEVIYEGYALDLKTDENQDKKESHIDTSSINEDEDSCDSYQPLTILKKKSKPSKNKKGFQFKCTICTRSFPTKYYLDAHIQKHNDSQFQCSKCNRIFAKELQLIQHQYSHNGYPCQECGKRFRLKSSLKYHLDTHKGEKKFICDFDNCGKAFMNKRRLTAHKNVHYSNTECVCEICGSRQRNKNSLRDHIRTHTGERPFACPLCDHRFTSRSLLYEHKACHETERKHICDVCGKDFNRQKALYHHKHLHLAIKKFICKICGSAYAQAAGLSAHRHAPQELLPNNKDSVENSNFNSIHQTKIRIIIHGWLGFHNSIPNKPIHEAYLTQGNYNLISVDWNVYAKRNYVTARRKVPVVEAIIAEFVDFLHNGFHLSYDSLVVIGHSFGMHVAGFCGKSVQYGQLSYIVGLDPSGPLFDYNKPDRRLSENDAKYDQTIQKNDNGQDTLEPIVSAVFYGNWGRTQPDCGKDLTGKCSHDRCVYLYAEAVKGYSFSPMYKCESYENILNKKDYLDLVKGIQIGDSLQIERKAGIYHFTTNSEAPFGLYK